MASLTFSRVYAMDTSTTVADIEANQVNILFFDNLGPGTISDSTANAQFSGADVAVQLKVGSNTYYGWITRDVKFNGDVRGFYFWTDSHFHSVADALAQGNQDPDTHTDNIGFVFVTDPPYFDNLPFLDPVAGTKHLDTSSEPVASQLNSFVVGAPTVTITEDANNDGIINAAELSGDANVHVAMPSGTSAGDTLTVSDGTTTRTFVLTAAQVSGGVDTAFAQPAEGATLTVTAFITDTIGIVGGTGSDSARRDTAGPSAPTVAITEDANNDGTISASELSGNADVRIGLPTDAVAGDVLSVASGATTQTFTLTSAQITAHEVLTSFAPPAEGATMTVTAHVTDSAGNVGPDGSDSAIVDTSGPPAPTVTITEDANNDGAIAAAELSGNVDVSLELPAGVVPGDVLHATDGTTTRTFTLTAQQIAVGIVNTDFAPPAEHGTITVTSYIVDQAGNQGASGTDSATRHSFGPSAPTVVITEDADNDGVITGAELRGDVDVRIALPTDAVAGDVLTVTEGSSTHDLTLTSAQITAGVVVDAFTPPAQGARIDVWAYVTDQVGNQGGTGSDFAVRDTSGPPAPVVTITEDADNDGILLDGELVGNVDVRIGLPAGALAGDVLTISDGHTVQTVVLTAAQVTGGLVATHFAPPPEHGKITVEAYLTDQSGNQGGTGRDSALRESFGPAAPNVTITEDANNDGVIVKAELSGDIDVRVDLPGDVLAGDVLTVTDGTTTRNFTLTASQLAAGFITTAFGVPPDGSTITVVAYATDKFGQQGASDSDSAILKSGTMQPPTVVIVEDANNDGYIVAAELSGNVDVRIAIPAGVIPGDVLHVTDGLTAQDVSLTAQQISTGHILTAFAPPPEGGTITVTAYVTDSFGQASGTGSDWAILDTQAPPAPVIVITEDTNDDGFIRPGELSGPVDARIALAAGTQAGDVLHVTDGLTTRDVVLSAGDVAAGAYAMVYAVPGEDQRLTLTAWLTDPRGNPSASSTDSAVLDMLQTLPVYTVRLESGDRFYTTDASEAAEMAQGQGNVFEGAQFDSLTSGGVPVLTWHQPFTDDWFFGADGVPPPYACYERVPEMSGFHAALAGQGPGSTYHVFLNDAGLTQYGTQDQAAGFQSQGYRDLGVAFDTTNEQAFVFDAEGYLVANRSDAQVVTLVHSLAQAYGSTQDAGFIEAVEHDYLTRVQLTGIAHGGNADATDVNAAFGTSFA